MGAERAINVVDLPAASFQAQLERLIDARVDARLRALGVGARKPTRSEIRRRAGYLTQHDLEVAAQLGSGWVSMLEAGHIKRPGVRSRAALERLCAALHCEPHEYCEARADE
jgi:DNA-binding Xre family transcriptional regulator